MKINIISTMKFSGLWLSFFIFLFGLFGQSNSSKVTELSDRLQERWALACYVVSCCWFEFVNVFRLYSIFSGSPALQLMTTTEDGGLPKPIQKLVQQEFYAPWCAHCKRLEPVWAHVAQSLYNTSIHVGRIDCTRYTSVSTLFGISGFPTIMFLKGDTKEYTFDGDRTKEEIMHFALRLNGPPVQRITRHESLDHLKATQKIFFVYVGSYDGALWENYYDVAERFQPHSFFYSTSRDIARKHVKLDDRPAIFVLKESSFYTFEEADEKEWDTINASLTNWVNTERFGTFVKITKGNIHQFMETNKYLVLAIVHENKLEEVPEHMLVFRDMIESIIRKHRDKYHKWFQFGWIATPDLANSIAMTELPLPCLLVVNSTTNHHHFPDDEAHRLTPDAVHMFLESIRNQSATCYGGNSLPVRMYKTYFEAKTALAEMWRGNPVLTAVLFGLPFAFLSLIMYSICCSDILDASDDEDSAPDYGHEKKE